jgi:hypothetical protein
VAGRTVRYGLRHTWLPLYVSAECARELARHLTRRSPGRPSKRAKQGGAR